MTELPDWVKPGSKFRVFYSEGNPNNRTLHIRGIVDDRAIVREWFPSKQRWYYEALEVYWFDVFEPRIIRTERSRAPRNGTE